MGPACALVEIKDGKRHLLDRLAEVALRARRRRRACSACRPTKVHASGCRAPAPTAATTPTTAAMDCGGARQGGRQAGAPAIHARPRHRLGPEGPGLDPPRPRGDRRAGQRHRLRVHSARASRASTSTPTAASRPTRSPATPLGVALKSGDGFGVPAESYAFANKRTALGDDRAAARPRLAAAHVASARSGRAADPLRQRVLHGRGGGGARADPIEFRLQARQGRRATSR